MIIKSPLRDELNKKILESKIKQAFCGDVCTGLQGLWFIMFDFLTGQDIKCTILIPFLIF